MRPKWSLLTLLAAFASALCLCACGSEDPPPSSTEFKEFRAYPVYWSGDSVEGNDLVEVMGDPTLHEDERETTWILIYGDCKDPPDEEGCPPPLQIHSYSTCERWAELFPGKPRLFDFRGAKATKPFPGGGAGLEIFTGRTTITLHAESQDLLDAATRALRTVHQKQPSSSLPPPVPGSLKGELPCQG